MAILMISAAHGANITCVLHENENFQIDINACNVVEVIALERGEPLNFLVSSNNTENITAVHFTPPGQIQLNITFLPRELFRIFPKLEMLELRAKVESLEMVDFLNARNLKQLTLNNQLSRLSTRVFSVATNLTNLVLSRNRISEIEDYAFEGLAKLEQLALAKNQLTRLTRLMFTGLPKLNFLNLRDNDIASIDDGTFELPSLDELILSKNKLKRLSDTLFQGAPTLRNIAIDNNDLEHIGSSLYGLRNAARIVLYQNKISDVDIVALSRLPELTTLWMRESGFTFANRSLADFVASDSKITYLDISANHLSDPDDFQRLTIFRQLKTLVLDGNAYTELNLANRTMRQYFSDMDTIHLSQNKWNCDWLRPVITQLTADHIRAVSSDCQ